MDILLQVVTRDFCDTMKAHAEDEEEEEERELEAKNHFLLLSDPQTHSDQTQREEG